MSIVIYATELNNEDNSVSDDTLRLVNQDNDFVMSVGLNPIINNPVSDISVPVRVSFDNTDVLSYTVETDGLIATETTEDSMEYDITVTDEYGVFTIYATYPDDVVAQSSIYTYSNGYSVYLSEFSKENALEKYLECAILDNIYTLEEAKAIWSGFVCENENIDQEIGAPTPYDSEIESKGLFFPDDGVICGTLTWKDDHNIIHLLRRVRVNIYRKGSLFNVYLGTTYTDDWGYFEKDIPPGEDVFIRVYAGDGNITIGSPIHQWWYAITFDKSEQLYDVNSNSVTTVDIPPISMNTDAGKAIQIAQAVLTARDYSWLMSGERPSSINIVYPYDFEIEDSYDENNTNGCFYSSELATMFVTGRYPSSNVYPTSYASWDVIMHEYGHHIQYDLNIIDSLGAGHASNINMADHYKNHYESGNFDSCNISCFLKDNLLNIPSSILNENDCKYEGDKISWAEAWPTVFGMMAQDYYSSQLSNIDTVADTYCKSYNGLNYDVENTPVALGEACERSIIAVLWDIYDNQNEENDNISLSHQAFWDLSTIEGTYTFSDFIENFYDEYPEYIDDIASNLTKYKMAATKPTISNVEDISFTNSISLSWSAQGGSNYYPNNRFSVIVYKNEIQIFKKDNITTNSYTLTLSEWQQLLSNVEYTCNENLDIKIAIIAYQVDNDSHITGPYYSECVDVSIQLDHNYELYNYCYEKCSECGYTVQAKEHDFTCSYESMNAETHYAYCECGAGTVDAHTFSTLGVLDICIYCKLEKDHVHQYTYISCMDEHTHRKICSCGISVIEPCFGITAPDLSTCCIKCGQTMNGGAIRPWSKDDEIVPLDDENNDKGETE